MLWNLSEHTHLPLYQQIITLIEQAILQGELPPGERLPAERQLSTLLNVNRSTIIRALDELTDRGLLIRKIGAGTFVNPAKWEMQSYPTLNWHPFQSAYMQYHKSDYQLHLMKRRKQAQENGLPIIDMATGDLATSLLPDLNLTDLPWKDLLSLEQDDITTQLGLLSFRKSIQHHMKTRLGLSVDLSEILITTGTQQALFLLSQTLLKPGDAIGVEAPSSFYRLPIFQASGIRIYALPMDQQGVIPEEFKTIIQKTPLKMIFLNPVFQNPTGTLMPLQRKQEILRICHAYQIPLIEDDAYSMLAFQQEIEITPIKFHDTRNQVIYLGSLSKYIGKSVRAGWIIAPQNIIARLAEVRRQVDGGISVLPQFLAEHYLSHQIDSHTTWLQRELSAKASQLCNWLPPQVAGEIQFEKPQGGLYLYARYPDKTSKEISQLAQRWLNQNITLAQGEEFGGKVNELRFNFSHFHPFSTDPHAS